MSRPQAKEQFLLPKKVPAPQAPAPTPDLHTPMMTDTEEEEEYQRPSVSEARKLFSYPHQIHPPPTKKAPVPVIPERMPKAEKQPTLMAKLTPVPPKMTPGKPSRPITVLFKPRDDSPRWRPHYVCMLNKMEMEYTYIKNINSL